MSAAPTSNSEPLEFAIIEPIDEPLCGPAGLHRDGVSEAIPQGTFLLLRPDRASSLSGRRDRLRGLGGLQIKVDLDLVTDGPAAGLDGLGTFQDGAPGHRTVERWHGATVRMGLLYERAAVDFWADVAGGTALSDGVAGRTPADADEVGVTN